MNSNEKGRKTRVHSNTHSFQENKDDEFSSSKEYEKVRRSLEKHDITTYEIDKRRKTRTLVALKDFDTEIEQYGEDDDEGYLGQKIIRKEIAEMSSQKDNSLSNDTSMLVELLEHVSLADILEKIDAITAMEQRLRKVENGLKATYAPKMKSSSCGMNICEMARKIEELSKKVEKLISERIDDARIEEKLEHKVDMSQLYDLVPQTLFDNACNNLTCSIDEIFRNIRQQEEHYQQQCDDVHSTLENKLDKIEIEEFKEFLSIKLGKMSERMKALEKVRDAEGSAVRTRVIRDVNCIACDANVVMRSGWQPHSPQRAMSTRYLTRLSKKSPHLSQTERQIVQHAVNRSGVENCLQSRPSSINSRDELNLKLMHLCQRYCGGSHTLTKPEERIVKKGNFVEYLNFLSRKKMVDEIRVPANK